MNPFRCVECGRLDYEHHGDGKGTLWCTADGAEKGYGHYFGPKVSRFSTLDRVADSALCQKTRESIEADEESPVILTLSDFPPPCDGCGRRSDAAWPSGDELFYVCGECTAVLPGVA